MTKSFPFLQTDDVIPHLILSSVLTTGKMSQNKVIISIVCLILLLYDPVTFAYYLTQEQIIMVKKLLLCLCLPLLLFAACSSSTTGQSAETNKSGKVIEVFKSPT